MEFDAISDAIKKHRTLAQMLADQIITQVSTGKLKPGDILPLESKLCKNFKVGASTLREALRILETMGILEVIPRKGVYIRSRLENDFNKEGIEFKLRLSRKNLPRLLEFWFIHIVGGANLACNGHTSKDIKEFKNIINKIAKCVEMIAKNKANSRTFQIYADQNFKFFSCLGRSTHNIIYIKIMNALLTNLNEYLPLSQISFSQDKYELKNLLKLAREFIRAFEERNSVKAIDIAQQEVKEIKRIIYKSLNL